MRRQRSSPLAYVTIAVALAAVPAVSLHNEKEYWECTANSTALEPVNLIIRFSNGYKLAKVFATKQKGDRIIVSGEISLEDKPNTIPVVTGSMFCDAHDNQFVNEVVLVGRLAKEGRLTDSQKSASRSLAVNRYPKGEETTDWYRLRGFGYTKDKLLKAPKGSLVSAHGILEQRRSREGNTYIEVKCRDMKVHSKAKGGGSAAPAGSSAMGYDQEDFEKASDNDMPFTWD